MNFTGTHESKIRSRPHTGVIHPEQVPLPPYWPDNPVVRRDWAQYYDHLMSLDEWVGKQLEKLSAAGLADRTIVVFYGDHGSGMPRHKRYAGDSGLRVPFIVYVPDSLRDLAPQDYQSGGRSDRLVEFVDLAPSMLSLAGVPVPDHMPGHPFLGQQQVPGPEYLFGFRDRMDERIDFSRMVRDQRYLYVRHFMPFLPAGQRLEYQMQTPTTATWERLFQQGVLNPNQSRFWQPRKPEALYDLAVDPHELNNLIEDPAFVDHRDRFRKALRQHTLDIRDAGFIPESRLREIQTSQIVADFCQDQKQYPIQRIYDLACRAAAGRPADLPRFETGLDSANPTERYWAAMGLFQQGEAAWQEPSCREALIDGLADPSMPVAIVAAETTARWGDSTDQAAGLARLAELADLRISDPQAALQALNAIERLGPRAHTLRPQLRTIPGRASGRGNDYPRRILKRLLPTQSP